MADGVFIDVRRFAVPPSRPIGGERFERRPRRIVVRRVVRRWVERWRGADGDPGELLAYLPAVGHAHDARHAHDVHDGHEAYRVCHR